MINSKMIFSYHIVPSFYYTHDTSIDIIAPCGQSQIFAHASLIEICLISSY